ncbi:MAG: peptidase M61, partial [Pseudomonadota bacterium]
MAALRYSVGFGQPGTRLLDIALDIAAPDPAGQALRLPAWIPGSYKIRDYARHVQEFAAETADGRPLAVTRTDKSTWQVEAHAGAIRVHYRVYAWDLSVRGAHADRTHVYFNGACVFVEAVGQGGGAVQVELAAAALALQPQWHCATAMRAADVDARGFGRYEADDYDDLIDHPVEIGALGQIDFQVAGIPHRIALNGARHVDLERLAGDVGRICDEQHRLLGAPAGFDRYLFLGSVVDKGYGGLEHRFSSSLSLTRSALPVAGDETLSDDYRRVLGLFSHEYFHLWNVRRMKPAAFTPFDLTAEAYTGLLWVFEGITSYYDDLTMVRSGAIDEAAYLELLGEQITRVLRVPGRRLQSLHDSSFEAWTKLYQAGDNAPNSIISYYTKGALVALALDLTLRLDAERCTLDAVMREAWRRYGDSGDGMPERGIETLAAELSGLELIGFFERYVHGTEDPPLRELLGRVGIELHLRAQTDAKDAGGKPADGARPGPWLGLRFSEAAPARIATVASNGPAMAAGLAPGDELAAIHGQLIANPGAVKHGAEAVAVGAQAV